MRRLRAAVAASVVLVGCAEVLGIPSADEASHLGSAFCKCDDGYRNGWPGEECADRFERGLRDLEDAERTAFLELFAKNDCQLCGSTEGRQICAKAAPICVDEGGACGAEVCCNQKGKLTYCGDNGRCVAEDQSCIQPGELCDPKLLNCCGAVGGKSACVRDEADDFRCSIEVCDLSNPSNCPTCCAAITLTGSSDVLGLCGPPQPDVCSLICGAAGDTCGNNQECLPFFAQDDDGEAFGTAHFCFGECSVAGTACGTAEVPGCCARFVGSSTGPTFACLPTDGAVDCSLALCDSSNPTCNNCSQTAIPNAWGEAYSFEACGF